jgi:hypothetical protein
MTPLATPERYKHHRFPAEIISHGVWLYYRCCFSYRDVEELLFVRGILVTYEAIRPTCQWERRRQGFKSAGHAQRFLAAYGPITQHFRPRRHWFSAPQYRQEMRTRCQVWEEITGTRMAA